MALTDRDEHDPPAVSAPGRGRRRPHRQGDRTDPVDRLAASVHAVRAMLMRPLERRAARAWARWSALPPWAQALVVYGLTRVIAFVLVDRTARFQPASVWNPAEPGYLGVVSLWDGDWYRRIAEGGYPSELPRNEAGQVLQNQWAFYPLYPAIARGVMEVTGSSWALAATIVSLLCGAAAVVVMRSLVEPLAGRPLALWTVVLFCCYPAAPILQLAYTESLAVLLLVSALWCLHRGRYLAAVPIVLLVGIARPIGAPLALVVGLHVLRALWRHRVEPLTRGRVVSMLALTAAAGAAMVLWPVVALVGTGESAAYTDTMTAWRVGHELHLFRPWLTITRYVMGYWTGPIVLTAVVAALVLWVTARSSRLIGWDLRVWCLAYTGYLLLVLDPFTSLARYLLLLFPLGTLLAAASTSGAYRRALAVAFLAGQVVWVVWLWRFVPPADWPP
jgi:hypothetical protein